MMFPNSNTAVITRLTKRSLKANRMRNRFVILAILLTTWLITSFFSIGFSYLKTIEQQNYKLAGTMAQTALNSPTEQQLTKLKELSYIKGIGLQSKVGNVINTPEMGDLSLSLLWYDTAEWNMMRKPAIDGLKGGYPQAKNEITVPAWILERLGIKNPKVGMSLPISYSVVQDGKQSQLDGSFVLSGWFNDYTHIRNSGSGEMLVSEAFAQSYGLDKQQPGRVSIAFKGKGTVDERIARLTGDITLQKNQTLAESSSMKTNSSDRMATLAGYGGIIFFVMLSGYLLIYNVLYISVSKDTRYYGLLKTIGTTRRQIKKMVRGQAMRLALIAIPLGLLAGAVTAFGIVPMALRMTNLETGIELSFHPVIFIGTALFAWLTTLAGCIKPASIAGKVSPVEAVRYTGAVVKAKTKRGTDGSKLHRLALRNIFRIKKRAIVVFLSLFMGLATFLIVTTIVMSMDTDNLVAQSMGNDFVLHNQTMSLGYEGQGSKPVITEKMTADIREMKGVTSAYPLYSLLGTIQYDAAVFRKYVDNFAAAFNIEKPSEEQLEQKDGMFSGSYVSGLETAQLRELVKKSGMKVDVERFEKGEIALLDSMGIEGLATGQSFELSQIDSSVRATFEIGGIGDFGSLESSHRLAPNVYLSRAGIEKLQADPLIKTLYINVNKQSVPRVSDEIKALAAGSNDLKLESRADLQAQMRSIKGTMYILGGGIGLILAFIGILNFINLMYTGALARKLEFAVMESIGMTSRQMKKLLLFEGTAYALISTVLLSTVGTLLSYGAFSLFVQEADYAVFTFPWVPLVISIMLVFAVCLSVPLIAYRQVKGASIVERLRQIE